MKKYNRIISFLVFALLTLNGCTPKVIGQTYVTKNNATGKAQKVYNRANQYKKNKVFDKAIKDFETVLNLEPTFIDAHYQLASIHFNEKNYLLAKQGLEKVISIDPNYKTAAYFYLGQAHWETDYYEDAASNFEQFLQSDNKSKRLKAKAETYFKNSQFAAEAIKHPLPIELSRLDSTINTDFAEYLPSTTADGNTLIFTRLIRRDEDVYMSKKIEGKWQEALPIEEINTFEKEGSQYISADGNLIVFNRFSRETGFGSSDLYYSEKRGDTWTKPKNMGQPINTRNIEVQPSLSADGKILYFASNRTGSLGGFDIWRSIRKENGEWGNPVNLGKTINTPANEECPFIHPDGKTLYFMSSGHQGMGGTDLFVSKRDSRKKLWKTPQNLGYPINTKENEGALIVTLDGETAYFTKDNLPEDNVEKLKSTNRPDIFTFEMPEALRPTPVTYVKATVKDAVTTKKLAGAKIEVIDLETDEVFSTSETDASGSFLACLPMGGNYALNVNKEKYFFHSENFELLETSSLQEPYLLKIKLQPIPVERTSETVVKSEPIVLKNVFFESGSAELKMTSLVELNYLKDLLTSNATLRIQINGHTDNVGTETDNLALSQNRAKAVQDYLIKEGIAADRLSYKGFGESQPIDTNDTEAGRKNNRRTAFITK